MSNLLHVRSKNDDLRICDVVLDLNSITVHCIINNDFIGDKFGQHCIINWSLKNGEQPYSIKVIDSYESLIERIFGEKKCSTTE